MRETHDPGGIKTYPLQQNEACGRIIFGGDDDKFRYFLERIFEPDKITSAPEKEGSVLFWLMNPAKADARIDDSTVHFCWKRTRRWGYGRMGVVNTGAYRSTYPSELAKTPDPIGPENRRYVIEAAKEASLIVVGCGVLELPSMQKFLLSVAQELIDSGLKLHILKVTQGGWPGHPLYLDLDLEPTPWTPSPELIARVARQAYGPKPVIP